MNNLKCNLTWLIDTEKPEYQTRFLHLPLYHDYLRHTTKTMLFPFWIVGILVVLAYNIVHELCLDIYYVSEGVKNRRRPN